MYESQDSCNAEIARLQSEVQRLEKELFDATQPRPGWEYKVLYVDSVGVYHMSSWHYESLESFAKCVAPLMTGLQLLIPTGRQKYE